MTVAELKGDEDYNNTSSVKNDAVLINLIILGSLWYAPRKIF